VLAAAAAAALLATGGAGARPANHSDALSPAEAVLLDQVNAVRLENGLRPLRVDATLERAARWYTGQMLAGNFFSHGDFGGRMAEFGVRGSVMGENLAWGTGPYARASSVVGRWLSSADHRANLLRPDYTRIGIGSLEGRFLGFRGSTVVTADFAG
jgi:uncharacterized protein YkwD